MISSLLNWIQRLIADSNGVPDEARLMAVLVVLVYLALAVWNVGYEHRPFDYAAFGQGIGFTSAGIGAWFFGRGKN